MSDRSTEVISALSYSIISENVTEQAVVKNNFNVIFRDDILTNPLADVKWNLLLPPCVQHQRVTFSILNNQAGIVDKREPFSYNIYIYGLEPV